VTHPRTRTVSPACEGSSEIREYGEVIRIEVRGKVEHACIECQPRRDSNSSTQLRAVPSATRGLYYYSLAETVRISPDTSKLT
jgi:hypothetical protein